MSVAGKGGRPLGLPKTGGRKAGTPNRDAFDARQKLDAIGCDPLLAMAAIARDPSTEVGLRVKCLSELASYVYSKRKATDGSAAEAATFNVNTTLDDPANPEPAAGEIPNEEYADVDVHTSLHNSEEPSDDSQPQS
jgi:hypothetical protein